MNADADKELRAPDDTSVRDRAHGGGTYSAENVASEGLQG